MQEQFQDLEFIKFAAFCKIHSHEFVNKMQISKYMNNISTNISKKCEKYILSYENILCSYPLTESSCLHKTLNQLVGSLSNIVILGMCVFFQGFAFKVV